MSGSSTIPGFLVEKGLTVIPMAKDGACFFRAAAFQLFGTQDRHMETRKNCVDYMFSNKDMFEPFIAGEAGETVPFDHYCFEMNKAPTWAGEVELLALSLCLGGVCSEPDLQFYFENEHYDAVVASDSPLANGEDAYDNWQKEKSEQERVDENLARALNSEMNLRAEDLSGAYRKDQENEDEQGSKGRRQGSNTDKGETLSREEMVIMENTKRAMERESQMTAEEKQEMELRKLKKEAEKKRKKEAKKRRQEEEAMKAAKAEDDARRAAEEARRNREESKKLQETAVLSPAPDPDEENKDEQPDVTSETPLPKKPVWGTQRNWQEVFKENEANDAGKPTSDVTPAAHHDETTGNSASGQTARVDDSLPRCLDSEV